MLIVLCEDLHCGLHLVCIDDLAFVALEWPSSHENSLAVGSLVRDSPVKLALLETEIVRTLVVLGEGLVDQLKACIDYMMTLDCVDAMSFSKQVSIV